MSTVPSSLTLAQPSTESLALAFIDTWGASPLRRQFGDIHKKGETLLIIGDRGYMLKHFPFHCEYAFGTIEFNSIGPVFILTEGPWQKLGGSPRA